MEKYKHEGEKVKLPDTTDILAEMVAEYIKGSAESFEVRPLFLGWVAEMCDKPDGACYLSLLNFMNILRRGLGE